MTSSSDQNNDPKAEQKTERKRFKRKLTPFLCQEMLYDFATNQLDSERQQAVEEFLKKDRECQTLLEAIRRGIEYSEQLADTAVKPGIIAQLRESESALSLSRRYSKWASWPETVRWSVTALSVSAVVASIVALVPWQKLALHRGKTSDTIEIAQIPNNAAERLKDLQESNEAPESDESDEGSGDEGFPIVGGGKPGQNVAGEEEQDHSGDHEDAPPSKVVAKAVTVAPTAKPLAVAPVATPSAVLKPGAEAGKPIVIMAPAQPVAAAPLVKATPIVITANAGELNPESAQEKKDPKARGFVYRAFMNLKDLETVGPKITEIIREDGGEKAGEVELGWKRGAGRYYHFSMPEENEEKLLEQLRAYGPVRISKDPHPRIMPQGQVRFILWIESAD